VSVYQTNWASRKYTLLPGEIVRHHSDGSYGVKWETRQDNKILVIPEHYVFAKNNNLYHENQEVLSCWTDYALNKNSSQRYRKFKAVIRNVNENGTYCVDFLFKRDKHRYSQCVREMWITTVAEEIEKEVAQDHWDDDSISSLCLKVAKQWSPRCVGTFLLECCHNWSLSSSDKSSIAEATRLLFDKSISGEVFTSLTLEELTTKLGMSRSFAKKFYESCMYFIHNRVVSLPEEALTKREEMGFEVPGGGKPVFLRRS